MAKIHHMVFLKFKQEVNEDALADAFAQLAQLQELIPGIEYFQGGPYSSPEGLNKGFNYAFLMTFRSVASRDNYLPHPEHERVKAQLIPLLDDFIAVDIED